MAASSHVTPEQAGRNYWAGAVLPGIERLHHWLVELSAHEEAEAVHQARVEIRRLRNMFEQFQRVLPGKRTASWDRRCHRLAAKLGAVRDLDVQLGWVGRELDQCHSAKLSPGMKRLALRLEQDRRRRAPTIARAVHKFERASVIPRIRQLAQRERVRKDVPIDEDALRAYAQHVIDRSTAGVLNAADGLVDPEAVEQHHELRKRLRKLCDSLEIFKPAFQRELAELTKRVKAIQQVFGDMHDCDVRLAWLPQFVEREKQRTIEYCGHARPMGRITPGLNELMRRCETRRAALFAEGKSMWDELVSEGFWEAMSRLLPHDAVVGQEAPKARADAARSEASAAGDGSMPRHLSPAAAAALAAQDPPRGRPRPTEPDEDGNTQLDSDDAQTSADLPSDEDPPPLRLVKDGDSSESRSAVSGGG